MDSELKPPSPKRRRLNDDDDKIEDEKNEDPVTLFTLPHEIMIFILRHCDETDVYSMQKVCKQLSKVAAKPLAFDKIVIDDITKINNYMAMPKYHSISHLVLVLNEESHGAAHYVITRSISPFPRLSTIDIQFCTDKEGLYDDFGYLLEGLLRTGRRKILNIGDSHETCRFKFDVNAMKNVETINYTNLFGFHARPMINQIFRADLGNHKFEAVNFEICNESEEGDRFPAEWKQDFFQVVAAKTDYFTLKLRVWLSECIQFEPNVVEWKEFVDNLVDSKRDERIDELEMKFRQLSTGTSSRRLGDPGSAINKFKQFLDIWMCITIKIKHER